MEATDLEPMIELLDDNIDDLEDALEPLLKAALSDTAGKLPLLDKAQLYVLVTYAIESILFSYLRLNGVNAREHPVFRELTRVKQYFEKIKDAESAGNKPNVKLDKAAAGRFIKHALAGNAKYDVNRAEQQAKEKAASHIRFQQVSRTSDLNRKASAMSSVDSSTDNSESDPRDSAPLESSLKQPTEHHPTLDTATGDSVKKGRKRKRKSSEKETESTTILLEGRSKEERKREKREKKEKKEKKVRKKQKMLNAS